MALTKRIMTCVFIGVLATAYAHASTNQNSTAKPTATVNDDDYSDEYSDDYYDTEDMFASDDEGETSNVNAADVYDPIIGINTVFYNFNYGFDYYMLRPSTMFYMDITPQHHQKNVSNFYRNLLEPSNSINLLLQGRPLDSLSALFRFVFNTATTLGLADPAADMFGLTHMREDLGQTLAVWGVPAGPYIMLPLLGPSSLRDIHGRFFDLALNPSLYNTHMPSSLTASGLYALNERAALVKYEGFIEPTYDVVKEIYTQKRQYDISNGSTGLE